MKKFINGNYFDVNEDEIEKIKQSESKQSVELSSDERLSNLENAMQDLILMTFGGK